MAFINIRVEYQFAAFLLLDYTIGVATGYGYVNQILEDHPYKSRFPWLWAMVFCGLVTTGLAVYFAGIEFGNPDMNYGSGLTPYLASVVWVVVLVCWTLLPLWSMFAFALVDVLFLALMWITPRGRYLQVVAVLAFTLQSFGFPLVWIRVAGVKFYHPTPLGIMSAVFMLLKSKTKYRCDEVLLVCLCVQPMVAFKLGIRLNWRYWERLSGSNDGNPTDATRIHGLACCMLGVCVMYACLLLRRTRRHLPPGLKKVKFVRLGHLRTMLAEGTSIQRRQMLPDVAFGDVSKAHHVVVVSHRWLHPRKCDVQDVKLRSLLEALEKEFSSIVLKLSTCSTPFAFLKALRSAYLLGGWDVIVFFDFMSMPQEGLAPDGNTVIARTDAEQQVFAECLPNMGTLYSTFQVLILTATLEGDEQHEYKDSGWCTCECAIAMLGRRLSRYSANQLHSLARASLVGKSFGTLDVAAAAEFGEQIKRELERKPFLHESDRAVAKGILDSFLQKRLLLDLVSTNSASEIRDVMSELSGPVRDLLLTAPVDASLNTMLHHAVRDRHLAATVELLRCGANPALRNVRGDTPTQCFLLPRFSKAARACRNNELMMSRTCRFGQVELRQL